MHDPKRTEHTALVLHRVETMLKALVPADDGAAIEALLTAAADLAMKAGAAGQDWKHCKMLREKMQSRRVRRNEERM